MWMFFSYAFTDYLIYFQIISTLGFAYLLTDGRLSEAKKHIKLIIVFTSISIVFAFTLFRWTTITTNFEQYGNYLEGSEAKYLFYLEDEESSGIERETILREGIALKYDIAFKQIWTFDAFMFFGTFLLLMALDKKEYTDKRE